jgi:hypothetical protein
MPKFKPVRDITKADCIRLTHDVQIGGHWRGGAASGNEAFYPSKDTNLRIERKAGTLIIGLVDEGLLFEVEVPLNAIHSVVYAPVKPEADEPVSAEA